MIVKNVALSSDGKVLVTKEAPVVVTGRTVGFVKFIRKENDMQWVVRHFACSKGTFDIRGCFTGKEEIVNYRASSLIHGLTPKSSFQDIENSLLNDQGWYIFGEQVDRNFDVRALEPYKVLIPTSTEIRNDKVSTYVKQSLFTGTKTNKGNYKSTTFSQNTDKTWNIGDKGLVMHMFGGVNSDDGNGDYFFNVPGTKDVFYHGHIAFGFVRVFADGISGNKRFDIEYMQVYGNMPEWVLPAGQKWHAYMGSTQRGYDYTLLLSLLDCYNSLFPKCYKRPVNLKVKCINAQ